MTTVNLSRQRGHGLLPVHAFHLRAASLPVLCAAILWTWTCGGALPKAVRRSGKVRARAIGIWSLGKATAPVFVYTRPPRPIRRLPMCVCAAGLWGSAAGAGVVLKLGR